MFLSLKLPEAPTFLRLLPRQRGKTDSFGRRKASIQGYRFSLRGVGWSVGWLYNSWLVGWLVSWLVGWLIGWLVMIQLEELLFFETLKIGAAGVARKWHQAPFVTYIAGVDQKSKTARNIFLKTCQTKDLG